MSHLIGHYGIKYMYFGSGFRASLGDMHADIQMISFTSLASSGLEAFVVSSVAIQCQAKKEKKKEAVHNNLCSCIAIATITVGYLKCEVRIQTLRVILWWSPLGVQTLYKKKKKAK